MTLVHCHPFLLLFNINMKTFNNYKSYTFKCIYGIYFSSEQPHCCAPKIIFAIKMNNSYSRLNLLLPSFCSLEEWKCTQDLLIGSYFTNIRLPQFKNLNINYKTYIIYLFIYLF